MDEINISIDGRELRGYKGQTILDIATENGIDIPTFCFDKRLDTYGSCGICVVEAEGMPKLLRSCATEATGGMVIRTDTPRVRESRKVNLELLLSAHTGDCRAPCSRACPAKTDCQGYVGLIANGMVEEALKLIKQTIPLAASIGRVCPHPCESSCRRRLVEEPVSILNLKRYVADIDLQKPEPYLPDIAPPTGKSVGIAGGGPGGLSCAYYLAQMGHSVTIYEAMPKMGGMLRYGIPEYRLPKAVVDKESALIEKTGVIFKNGVKIGLDMTFEDLRQKHDAIVVAIGAWVSAPLTCPGADMKGVYGGIDFLRGAYVGKALPVGKSVAVVGGGNTAMDACRTAIRLGAEKVYIIYRRSRAEMPAEDIEITEAEEEGVEFKYLVNPIEVIGENGKVTRMRLQKMKLGEPDASGRRKPEPIPGDEEILDVDTVITALGQGIKPDGFAGIGLTRWNTIVADEHVFSTNLPGVFAIGDCVNKGASIAIEAMGDASMAAAAVDLYLKGMEICAPEPYRVTREDLTEEDFTNRKKEPRSMVRGLTPDARKNNFLEVTEAFDPEAAIREAKRCLECGCLDYFECKLISLSDKHGAEPGRFKESAPTATISDDHPFIVRDSNKCILCGRCVRICEELIGPTALGLVDRGFDTVVRPAFGDALPDAGCISCGQCVAACPTGALQERVAFNKPVPLHTKKTDSVCGICAIGCSATVESYGKMLVKSTPAENRGVNGGIMCGRGRFGINYIRRDGRILFPLIRKGSALEQVSWSEALDYTAAKMREIQSSGGKTAVAVGQTYCIEDAAAIVQLGKQFGWETFSFANRENGLARVFGYDGSPDTLEDLSAANRILIFGTSMLQNAVILAKLRTAVKNGAKVTVIANGGGEFNLPCTVVDAPDSTLFIKQVIKALINAGCEPKNADGFDDLKKSLSSLEPGPGAVSAAESYISAEKAMIMYALGELTPEAAVELANMAVIAGHIGSPGDGIYMLRQASGAQALADCGVKAGAEAAKGVKGLMIFGEDPESLPDSPEFLVVQDTHMTKTAKIADVVFPLAAYPEIDGTFVNTERRLQLCNKAVDSPVEYRTSQIAQNIAEALANPFQTATAGELYPGVSYGNCNPSPVLYADGFAFPDKKAKLQTVKEAAMFDILAPTCSIIKAVDADIKLANTPHMNDR